jgi:hypothetical protein
MLWQIPARIPVFATCKKPPDGLVAKFTGSKKNCHKLFCPFQRLNAAFSTVLLLFGQDLAGFVIIKQR